MRKKRSGKDKGREKRKERRGKRDEGPEAILQGEKEFTILYFKGLETRKGDEGQEVIGIL